MPILAFLRVGITSSAVVLRLLTESVFTPWDSRSLRNCSLSIGFLMDASIVTAVSVITSWLYYWVTAFTNYFLNINSKYTRHTQLIKTLLTHNTHQNSPKTPIEPK